MTEKTEDLIAEARREESIYDKLGDGFNEGSEERAFYYEHRDRYKRLADALEAAHAREAARLRDLEYPEYVPESVTDAAFESQADWYTPGQGDGHAVVLVPKLIETVAEAAYRATLAHLEEAK